ncbi:hypothetical protein LPJ59_000322 [Coemansia sp. RSA 2399]|nr:hypothetical protein LPJ59_000322 [Coemansia sp. RSA 2399]KAJ1907844.1 hypothetical protein LPJ81_000493 [Coemansia sp. IMI 209127]
MAQESAAYTSHHMDPTTSRLIALHIDAVGEGTDDDGNISDDSASDTSSDVSDGESYVEKWYGGDYDVKHHMRSQSVGSQGSTSSNPFKRQVHHWRSRPPLLPERLATIVSSVSGATRLSLEITALFWEAVFDTIAESTSSGVMLGSVVWEEAKAIALAIASILSPLSSLNPQIVSHIVRSSTAAGYAAVNQSLTAAENILEGGFSLYTKAINMSLHAAGEYVRLIDAIFGSTDTSRVLASFVHMCRREALDKNPEIRALIGEVGLFSFVSQVLKTIVAWICLQVVNHGRSRPYRLDLVYTNIRRGPEFCPRKFIDSNGKPLSRKASFARAPPEPLSPRISAIFASEISAASPQSTMHGKTQSDAAANAELSRSASDICRMHNHVCAQTALAATGHESHSFSKVPESDSKFRLDAASGDEYDDDDDNMYYALSDQDTPHRDPEWDQRLVEALRGLSVHLERQKQQQQQHQYKSDGKFDTNSERAEGVSDKCDQPDAASLGKDPNHPPQKQRPSVWERIAAVRAATARESQHTRQEQQHHSESTDTSSACGSPSSPLLSASIQRGMGLPTFESAPASLVSSPQFSTTPSIYPGEHTLHQADTLPEYGELCVSGLEHPVPNSTTNGKQLASDDIGDGCGSIPRLDDIPPTDAPFIDSAQSPKESVWLQQEFPRKPLLFNLARFISLASSVYGKSFMQVLGLDHGMIDARALIDEFGDFEVQDQDPAGTSRLSKAGSRASMNNEAGTSTGNATLLTTMPPRMGERTPSMSKLPRAQPMSTYHTHAGYNPARPDSQRQYERRHFRTPTRTDPSVGGGRRTLGRRPPVRRNHHRRRPVTDHPNHYCFSQHSGIPLGDLLFSSYVSPIVPGVTRAADVKAAAVERKLRRKSSLAVLQSQASQSSLQKGGVGSKTSASLESNGWIASIPIVGSIYQRLPSPTAAFSSIPVLPGLVSRVIGKNTSANKPKAEETARRSDRQYQQAVKPAGPKNTDEARKKFRRFEKIRQRLVYRNPSIHALVHYIAVDHATRSVVLACRGTLGISDLFIDMICEYETIRIPGHEAAARNSGEFRVHSGMWHSALLLADSSSEVFKEVAEALRLYPEYGLVLTGHSLGGGVASLVTLLWSRPVFDCSDEQESGSASPGINGQQTPGSTRGSTRRFVTMDKFGLVSPRPIHCFSFGSPCSSNAALSYYCRGLVTSVANSDDVITYLSIGACVDILNISAVLGREHGVAEKVMRKFFSTQKNKLSMKLNFFDFDFSKLRAYRHDDDGDDDSDGSSRSSGDEADSCRPGQDGEGKGKATNPQSRSAVQKDHIQGGSNNRSSKTPRHNGSGSSTSSSSRPRSKRQKKDKQSKKSAGGGGGEELDDWYLSLIKTLRANMDSEKLYPPGDVFVLATLGDDEIADRELLPRVASLNSANSDCSTEDSQGSSFFSTQSFASSFSSTPEDARKPGLFGREKASPESKDETLPVGLFYCPDVVERFSELRFTRNMVAHHLPSTYERRLSALVHETLYGSRGCKDALPEQK